jgi:hypothetical protein
LDPCSPRDASESDRCTAKRLNGQPGIDSNRFRRFATQDDPRIRAIRVF